MLEIIGRAGSGGEIIATVTLDAKHVGHITLTLAQWDRLRAHRRDAQTSERAGLQIVIEAERDD